VDKPKPPAGVTGLDWTGPSAAVGSSSLSVRTGLNGCGGGRGDDAAGGDDGGNGDSGDWGGEDDGDIQGTDNDRGGKGGDTCDGDSGGDRGGGSVTGGKGNMGMASGGNCEGDVVCKVDSGLGEEGTWRKSVWGGPSSSPS
jgi:hypothetical protein